MTKTEPDSQIREFYSLLVENLSQHPGGLKEALSEPIGNDLPDVRGWYLEGRKLNREGQRRYQWRI